MFFLDKPYVSQLLIDTIRDNSFPVINTGMAQELGFGSGPDVLDAEQASAKARLSDIVMIYTTSENSIGWISEHLSFTGIPEKINLFKNKVLFRTMVKPMYPDFYFKEITLDELDRLSLDNVPMPFIIKPAVGFFSMGVFKVSSPDEWENVKKTISSEVNRVSDLYPPEVFNTGSFIIEECIGGEEFAVDVYFNDLGEPVILNIMQHLFSSGEDVSDRVYITSKDIIERNHDQFLDILSKIGKRFNVKNFPVHSEFRREAAGKIIPIEINPVRFGGWCTTPDLAFRAYGFNPYEYYFYQKKPQWNDILRNKDDRFYSIVVLNNSTGIEGKQIESFNYQKLLSCFANPLELRKVDFREYPVFGFLFTETKKKDFEELERILQSDLKEFITVR